MKTNGSVLEEALAPAGAAAVALWLTEPDERRTVARCAPSLRCAARRQVLDLIH